MPDAVRDPKKLQNQVQQFQTLNRQVQVLGVQRQQMQMQIEELKLAQKELETTTGEVYKAVGNLLVQTKKAEAKKELDERVEVFEVRAKSMAKQEEQLKAKVESLRKEIDSQIGS